jgi:hypothetical protein
MSWDKLPSVGGETLAAVSSLHESNVINRMFAPSNFSLKEVLPADDDHDRFGSAWLAW